MSGNWGWNGGIGVFFMVIKNQFELKLSDVWCGQWIDLVVCYWWEIDRRDGFCVYFVDVLIVHIGCIMKFVVRLVTGLINVI